MEIQEVTNTVMDLINKSLLSERSINMTDRLVEDLGLDSIGFVELGTGLEEKYLIDISDEELEGLQTVECVVNTVLKAPTYAAAE